MLVLMVSGLRFGIMALEPKAISALFGVAGREEAGDWIDVSEGVRDPSNMSEFSRPGSDSEDEVEEDEDESVDSDAHVAPQDERLLFQGISSYADASVHKVCLAKMISEVVSLLQRDPATSGRGEGERGRGGSVSSEESVSISMPDSQGQRAMLPSKMTPSE
jgi:hypothetical protein